LEEPVSADLRLGRGLGSQSLEQFHPAIRNGIVSVARDRRSGRPLPR
jgi:hypothetical protein